MPRRHPAKPGDAAAVRRVHEAQQPLGLQRPQRGLHLVVVDMHHRLPRRRLVARRHERVESQRVLVRGGALLLHQAAEHTGLDHVEHGGKNGTVIRLRQVALVAADLDALFAAVRHVGRVRWLPRPGRGMFGLHNALMMIGDQFLEVVAPTQEGTTAGRLLAKRGGDGGYMAIFEVDDLDAGEAHLAELGVRIVWRGPRTGPRPSPPAPGRWMRGIVVSTSRYPARGTGAGRPWDGARRELGGGVPSPSVVVGADDPVAMVSAGGSRRVAHAVHGSVVPAARASTSALVATVGVGRRVSRSAPRAGILMRSPGFAGITIVTPTMKLL